MKMRRWKVAIVRGVVGSLVAVLMTFGGNAGLTYTAKAAPVDDPSRDRTGSGGTLVIGMTASNVPIPNTPTSDGAEGIRWVANAIYDTLVAFNLDQGDSAPVPVPALAERWGVSSDKLTWTFRLRKGVKFHDGTDFNAEAAVFQLDRITNKDFAYFDERLFSANRFNTRQITSYRAIGTDTLEIKTHEPYALLLWDLTSIFFPSPAVVKKYGNRDYVRNATGTGPFRMTRYIDGQVMELERFDEHWRGKAKLDKIILRPMPDASTRLAALQAGDILWADFVPPDSLAQVRSRGYTILLRPYPHTMVFYLNMYEEPFNNPKVREALQYAIDREKLCKALLQGLCIPATQLAYPGHPWYEPNILKKYRFFPARAKQILADAGYPNGFTINVAAPTGGSGNMWPSPMLEFIQSNLKDVGIEMKITMLEFPVVSGMTRSGLAAPENRKYHAIYVSQSWGAPFLADRYASWRIPPQSCCNPGGFKNPEYDRLMKAVEQEFELAKQHALIRKALSTLAVDSGATFIVHDLNLRVLSPKVRGFIQPQAWYVDLRNVWVRK